MCDYCEYGKKLKKQIQAFATTEGIMNGDVFDTDYYIGRFTGNRDCQRDSKRFLIFTLIFSH